MLLKGLKNSLQTDVSPSGPAPDFSLTPPSVAAPQDAKHGMYSRSLSLFDDASINELLLCSQLKPQILILRVFFVSLFNPLMFPLEKDRFPALILEWTWGNS